MQLHQDNFEEHLPLLLRDIEQAQFVAIDFEMTGLYESFRRCVGEQEAYEWYRRECSQFLPIQLGICTVCPRQPGDGAGWLLQPYTIDIFPGDSSQCFKSSLSSLEFLRKNQFDFNRWIDTGVRYSRKDASSSLVKYRDELARLLAAHREQRGEVQHPTQSIDVHKKEDKVFVERTLKRVHEWVAAPYPQPLVFREPNSYRRTLILQELPKVFPALHTVTVPGNSSKRGAATSNPSASTSNLHPPQPRLQPPQTCIHLKPVCSHLKPAAT